MQNKGYFQPEQAREVAEVFAKYKIEYLFIGKSGAILLGYPATTQDVDLFPEKSEENCRRIVPALKEIGFKLSEENENKIIKGVDFVQLNQDPFDLDLIFAPDGIESFEKAKERMIQVDKFPIANIRDIIASKKASGREKDLNDLPLLLDFQEELEKKMRGEPKTALK
jgi:predicted nucleotidyltransferase